MDDNENATIMDGKKDDLIIYLIELSLKLYRHLDAYNSKFLYFQAILNSFNINNLRFKNPTLQSFHENLELINKDLENLKSFREKYESDLYLLLGL